MTKAKPDTSQPIKRTRKAVEESSPQLAGENVSIRIPLPPASAFNRDRPITSLIQSQLQHVHHAESGRLPKHKRAGIKLEDIHTEAEAAAYMAAVTKVLHPRGRKKSKPQPSK
jgi:hypothetical protein